MQQSYRMARSTDHVVLIFVTFDDCARQVACQRSSCCSCVVIIFNAHVHRNDIKLGRPSAITCNQHHIKSVRSQIKQGGSRAKWWSSIPTHLCSSATLCRKATS